MEQIDFITRLSGDDANMNETIQKRKQKWKDFYDGKINSLVLIGLDCGKRPWPYPENKTERIEYALNAYKLYLDSLEKVDDDRVPFIFPYTGTEIFARAFGCDVHYPDNDMPFALPCIHDAKELAKISYPELKNSASIIEIIEIADKLRYYAPEAIMQLPDIQSPLDIAALIWNKENFLIAMHDDPDAVKELIAMTENFLGEFLDMWFGRYGKDFIAHYPDYYMPYGITMSEDEVGAISPEMFREYSLDSINRLSERYGMIGIHCCANSMHQWENFKLIKNLKLLNIVQNHEICQKAYVYFNDVCTQMHCENVDDGVFRKYGNKGMRVIIQDSAENAGIASEKSKAWRAWQEKYI